MRPVPDASHTASATRPDGRSADQLRPVGIEPGFVRSADGSALISMGGTRVICTASLVDGVPNWREGSGRGWLTAEYGMLPASTGVRRTRDSTRGRPDGRTVEIQRLIGRSARAVIDLDGLGERTVYLDCDVLEADGGTRCAAITGAYVALKLGLDRLVERGDLVRVPLRSSVAAVSCGIVGGAPVLDLDYREDSSADVDMNVVMTGAEELVEVQATGEGVSFSRDELDRLLELAAAGIASLRRAQDEAAGPLTP
jgi:ribonuclease PH